MKFVKIVLVLLMLAVCGCGRQPSNGPKYHVGQVLRTAVGNKQVQIVDDPVFFRGSYLYRVVVDRDRQPVDSMYEFELVDPILQ